MDVRRVRRGADGGRLRLAVEQIVPAGDHRIVVGRVEEVWLDESRRPLLFHDGGYHAL